MSPAASPAVSPDDGHWTHTTAARTGPSGSGLGVGTELAPMMGDGAAAAVADSKVWLPLFLFVANVILSLPAVELVHALSRGMF